MERMMMGTRTSRETTKIRSDATGRRSRLDDILARHQRRRIQTVAVLILWTVLCGALLAM